MNGLVESPPPIVAINTTLVGLALLSTIVSNGTTIVTILFLYVLVLEVVELLLVILLAQTKSGLGLPQEFVAIWVILQNVCLSFISFIRFICASKSS